MTADILKVEGLTKTYGETLVLDNVSFTVAPNSIVGVVGENGAGKSTLFNIISGIVRPDSGRVEFRGKEIRPANYKEANLLGISRVFQEQALIPNITVYENILLSHEGQFTRFGQVLDKKRMIETARRIVDAMKLDIDVQRRTSDYDFSKRQSIEIARACLVPREVLAISSPLILLDEPTSALEKSEEEAFFRLIRSIREHGSALFVSHRLSEVLSVCDLIHVLKDGRLVATVRPHEINEHLLHGLMVGRERDADYYHEEDQENVSGRSVLMEVRDLSLRQEYREVSFDVRQGEILGIGGLLDSGKSHLGKGIAGLDTARQRHRAFGRQGAEPPGVSRSHCRRPGLRAERTTVGRNHCAILGRLEYVSCWRRGHIFESTGLLARCARRPLDAALHGGAGHQGAQSTIVMRYTFRRQSTKGRVGEMALPVAAYHYLGQSDPWHRCRGQGGGVQVGQTTHSVRRLRNSYYR